MHVVELSALRSTTEGATVSSAADANRRAPEHFYRLTRAEQVEAIRRMRDEGHSDYSISAATKWSVEAVRQALGERR